MDKSPFIRIEHIDDVAPHISFDLGFVVSRRPDHSVIDYVYTTDETFLTPIARECRGLKFDASGKIIGRPFHKFFNLGEKERVEDIDWSQPHATLDKLDGSMVHPVRLNGEIVFMTRMGMTDQSAKARLHADASMLALCSAMLDAGVTPIFEFTSPDNRIVVAYDKPRITLLAARQIISGDYFPHTELTALGNRFGVPVAANRGAINEAKTFVAEARELPGIEGYVIAFDSGHRIKLKTDGYVLRHKALSGLSLEKNVLAWVAARAVDDVVPLLSDELAKEVLSYQATVLTSLSRHAGQIKALVAQHGMLPRKDFAAIVMKEVDPRLRGAAFSALDGRDPAAALMGTIESAAKSGTSVDAIRDLFGMRWDVSGLAMPDLEA
jgi:RNA ligase